jgi:aminoglycoside 3-N-acetyltransferase
MPKLPLTRRALRADLAALGVAAGDVVMIHAALRRVGPMMNGPDALIGALLDVLGEAGTLAVYTDWDACYHDYLDADGKMPEALRADIPPFDPATSRANRDHGAIAEFIRTTPGAVRSASAGASVAAIGTKAAWLTADHPLNYGYGEGSPFDKIVQAEGKVLMVGAPLDTMTILHHAEHKANIPGKRVLRVEVPFARAGGVEWQMIEEFDTSDPIVEALADDYFRLVVAEFLATSSTARQGLIGAAPSVLVPAREVVEFGVAWLERRFSSRKP